MSIIILKNELGEKFFNCGKKVSLYEWFLEGPKSI
jgi:hypothetical protein